ncbi:MAG: hypothetical protein JNJ50_12805 [Acidobacteria bacterium]|nr:hypothetical protein [Acidobacteriota bacterium]
MADTNNTVTREQWLEGIAKLVKVLQVRDAFLNDKNKVLTDEELRTLYSALARKISDRDEIPLADGSVKIDCPEGTYPCSEGCCSVGFEDIFPSTELPPQS